MKHLSFTFRLILTQILTICFVAIFCLLFDLPATAQKVYPREVIFETHDQNPWGAGPAIVSDGTYKLFGEDGLGYYAAISGLGGTINVELDTGLFTIDLGEYGLEFDAKFGLMVNLYAQYAVNSGAVDIEYPAKINFTVPDDHTYGCGEEVTIKTSSLLKSPAYYDLNIEEPSAEFAFGAEFGAGVFAKGRACAGICGDIKLDEGDPSFEDANESNRWDYLKEGQYDFFRLSSETGLKIPMLDLNLPLPFEGNIDAAELDVKLLDDPFRGIDVPDVLSDKVLVNNSDYQFLDIEFDPLQFQKYFTGIPLEYEKCVVGQCVKLQAVSMPLILEGKTDADFEFDPRFFTDIEFEKELSWKEMDGAAELRSGTSKTILDFYIGHDLKIIYPDNKPLSLTPTLGIQNEFRSKLEMDFESTLAIRILNGELIIDYYFDDASIPFTAFEESIPLGNFSIQIHDNNFEMAGFSEIPVAPFTLTPDMAPPLVTPKNITLYIPDAGGTVSIIPEDVVLSATDADGGVVRYLSVVPNTFGCANLGENTVLVTLDDSRCNTITVSATVTIVDRTKPTMLCKNATIYLDATGQATLTPAQVDNGSYDNCGIIVSGVYPSLFSCDNLGDNTVILGGADAGSNKNVCTATVKVVDHILPTTKCKNVTLNLAPDGTLAVPPSNVDDGSFDNCSFTLTLTPNTFNCTNVGLNTLTLRATDVAGNTSTCTASVTIKDATPPIARCKNATIFLNDAGKATLSVSQINNGSSDACGIATMNLSQTLFNCSELLGSPWTITMTVKDVNTNVSTCLATVSVKDVIAPTAVCQNTIVYLQADGKVTVNPADLALNSFDNCSVWSFSPIAKVYTTANIGNNNLTITVKDWSGNPATCVSIVTVRPYTGMGDNGGDRNDKLTSAPAAFDFDLFPNPTTGQTTVTFNLPVEQAFIVRVFDMAGRMVFRHEDLGIEGENCLPIRLNGIVPGVYHIDLQKDGEHRTKRLVLTQF